MLCVQYPLMSPKCTPLTGRQVSVSGRLGDFSWSSEFLFLIFAIREADRLLLLLDRFPSVLPHYWLLLWPLACVFDILDGSSKVFIQRE